MTIMALVLVGILQMFSVSLIINKGAAARTQMLFKCQQVVENIRWYYFVTTNVLAMPLGTGIPALGAATVNLPYDRNRARVRVLGPAGSERHRGDNGPVQAQLHDRAGRGPVAEPHGVNVWVITVSAVPTDVASAPGATRYRKYSARIGGGKRVDYVAQFVQ